MHPSTFYSSIIIHLGSHPWAASPFVHWCIYCPSAHSHTSSMQAPHLHESSPAPKHPVSPLPTPPLVQEQPAPPQPPHHPPPHPSFLG
jgi:hypothetical protein